jgi:RsmE family RNA methyltransferase
MNMLILDEPEIGQALPRTDPRIQHIRKVLKMGQGDTLLAGITGDQPRTGQARIEAWDNQHMTLSFTPVQSAAELHPITVLLGFPRPIQARRILKDLCSLGVSRIILSGTELGEQSYLQSDFFRQRQFRPALLEGAAQAANPRLPLVETAWSLSKALDRLISGSTNHLNGTYSPDASAMAGGSMAGWALDPHQAELSLGQMVNATPSGATALILAIGSERGWTMPECRLLAEAGFQFAHLGTRILRTETAALVAVAIVLAGMGNI